MNTQRRKLLKTAAAAAVVPTAAAAQTKPTKKVHYKGKKPEKPGLFNGAVSYGNLLFIAGKGAHFVGDIKAHTKHVLDEIEKELVNAGSSMDKVLKCNVYLAKGEDYAAMKPFADVSAKNLPSERQLPPRGFRAIHWWK
jgi:2-iminobutanoate/2-iminopropanoate deaminase